MHPAALKAALFYLINKDYVGGKHAPENKVLKNTKKWITSKEKKKFEKEYKKMINKGIILRVKKRTGKSSSWHVSLNPRKVKEISRLLGI